MSFLPYVVRVEERHVGCRRVNALQSDISRRPDSGIQLSNNIKMKRRLKTNIFDFCSYWHRRTIINNNDVNRCFHDQPLAKHRHKGSPQNALFALKKWYDNGYFGHMDLTSGTYVPKRRSGAAGPIRNVLA